MPSLEELLQFISNRKKNINANMIRIESNTEADRRKLKKLKLTLIEAMEEFIKECDQVPMAKSVEEARRTSQQISYRRFFREELEKTENGEIPFQIIELYKESGDSIQIDKNRICKISLKGKEIYVTDQELIHLIEKLDIYDKDDENSIYRDIKAIKQNIIKNMFLNPSDKELDTDTLETINNKNVPKYIIDVLTDGTFIVEFNGQRHCLPYKFSRYISSMQGLTNENRLANEINYILETYMQELDSEGNKYSLTAVKELTDWMKDEYNSITILFDGEKYYAVDKETKSVAFLNEKQCEFLNKISSQTIKILCRKNKVRKTKKGFELDSDGNYIPTGEQIKFIEYGAHKTLRELMDLGYEFKTKDEKKDFKDDNIDWEIIITNPFGGYETKSARREWAKLNMPYTKEMIRLVRDFNGKPNEFYDYLYDKAKHSFEEGPIGEKLRNYRSYLRKINSVIDTRGNQPAISMKIEEKKKEIITYEEDGSLSIEEDMEEDLKKDEVVIQSNIITKGFIWKTDAIKKAKETAQNIAKLAVVLFVNANKKRKGRKKAKRIQSEFIRRELDRQRKLQHLRVPISYNKISSNVVDSGDYKDVILVKTDVDPREEK
ncbi:MAG: hypothetical protein IJK18_04150 [Clostridia bacterium]|nr:hypothetical protein [Clostridia bacterium]